jgi:hypothetical protein
MNWTNIKRWAKDKGYKVSREKSVDQNNPYNYQWHLITDVGRSGTTKSLSQITMDIYNDMTDNKHLEHQQRHKQELEFALAVYNSMGGVKVSTDK